MANVHEVTITGELPFDLGRIDPDTKEQGDKLLQWLGTFNLPSYGLSISWGQERMIPNKHGGMTAFYQYEIFGQEAVWYSGMERLKQLILDVGGTVEQFTVIDIEND